MMDKVLRFRDDDAGGYELVLRRGADGDFWLSMDPHPKDMDAHRASEAPEDAGIRVRMPVIGGGSHEALYFALEALWRGPGVVLLSGEEARFLFKRNIDWESGPFGLREKLVGVKRRRRPNPVIVAGGERRGTLSRFLHWLERDIRQGLDPREQFWFDVLGEFADKFRNHRMGIVLDDPEEPVDPVTVANAKALAQAEPIQGRSATVVTMDDPMPSPQSAYTDETSREIWGQLAKPKPPDEFTI